MNQRIVTIKEQILTAIDSDESIKVVGGNSKEFLGRTTAGLRMDMAGYTGIISYEPTELFITARAGTLLTEVKQALAEQGQMLPFEPPEVNEKSTIGGVVATGLSGPCRPYTGSVRDFVLGIRCINGLAKEMSFGGQVMKNVAGYDLSRLLTGSFGTLGIIMDVTFKVLPIPEFELSACKKMSKEEAIRVMSELSTKPIPISAVCYYENLLYVRFSGNENVIKDCLKIFELEEYDDGVRFWNELRNFKHSFFKSDKPLWRLSVPSLTNLNLKGDEFLMDWGGAQYWLVSDRPSNEIFNMAEQQGGSAMLFRGGDHDGDVFQPLSETLFKLHKNLKHAFDPHRVLNAGKMYTDI